MQNTTMRDIHPTTEKRTPFPWLVLLLTVACLVAALTIVVVVFSILGAGYHDGIVSRRTALVFLKSKAPDDASLFLVGMGSRWIGFLDWPANNVAGPVHGSRNKDGYDLAFDFGMGKSVRVVVNPLPRSKRREYLIEMANSFPVKGVGGKDFRADLAAEPIPAALESRCFVWMARNRKPIQNPAASLFSTLGGDWPPQIPAGARDGNEYLVIQALDSNTKSISAILNNTTRRGLAAESSAALRRNDILDGSFLETQTPVFSGGGVLSILTDRYVANSLSQAKASFYTVVDFKTGKRLLPGDVFIRNWKNSLGPLIERKAIELLNIAHQDMGGRKTSGKSSGKTDLTAFGFFDAKIVPSEDFFICGTGIGFHYDVYALAPASFGDFVFIVPWKELGSVLNDRYRNRLRF
jgi:hypothetical protein